MMSLFNISTQQDSNILSVNANRWISGELNRISSSNINKSNSSDDPNDRPPYTDASLPNRDVVLTDRVSANRLIISSDSNSISNKDTLPDPLANFTYSYYDKISLAKYWKPIKN